jgi:hypothetical protein
MRALRAWTLAHALVPVPWHLSVGVGIGILGFVGVIVPLIREKVGPREKALWTVVLLALLLIEIRSIHLDQVQHDREQALATCQQLHSFQGIATTLSKAIDQNQKEFESTVSHLDAVAGLTQRSVSSIVGGNSFCYTEFLYYTPYDGLHPLTIAHGKYPLYDVNVRIVDLAVPFPKTNAGGNTPEKFKEEYAAYERLSTVNIPIGNLAANSALSSNGTLSFDPSHGNFNLFFSARNGFWSEDYRSVAIDEHRRARAIRVFRGSTVQKPIYEKVDKDFPRNAGGTVKW